VSAPDILVVGGGVLGCAVGLDLARHGAAVTVIERDSIGSHASGFSYGGLFPTMGAGIPGPVLAPAKRSAELHGRLAVELKELTGIDVQLRPVESITLAPDGQELERLRADCEWQLSEGFDAEMLSPGDMARLEPLITDDVAGALVERSHQELDSYRYTLALATAVEKLGGTVRHGDATGLVRDGTRVAGVRTASGDEIGAGAVVLATGPWGGRSEGSGLPLLPVRPVKGEMLRLHFSGGDFERRPVLGGFYVHRKQDGLVWAGTTEEEAGFDDNPSEGARNAITAGVLRIAPSLENAAVSEHTACLRPVSEDGLPIVGPVRQADGLFVLNGAGKKGVLLSPVLAEMLAPVVLGEAGAAVLPAEFTPARFGL